MRRLLALVTVSVLLTGCAGIPTSGPVERVADDRGRPQSTVRYAPVGPPRGASPQQIVRGYLDAMLAYPVSTGTAASYLTPDAADSWKSSDGVTIYDDPRVTLEGGASAAAGVDTVDVELRSTTAATLDRQGHYTSGPGEVRRSYTLQKVRGQWRIADPQDGVMVTETYYDDYFRPFPVYYFDAPGQRLVPDLVHLAVGEQLATGLVTSLAAGPAEEALRTYVPRSGTLHPAVSVNDSGVADVEFSASLGRLSRGERNRLAAQIVWTLRAVPGVTGVRILGDGIILTAGNDRVNAIGSWGEYGPLASADHTYAIVEGAVVEIDGDVIRPIRGPWGRDARGSIAIAVSDGAVAAVEADRQRVRITARDGSRPRSHDGVGLVAPRWDEDGRLWLIDRPGGATRLRIVDRSGKARAVKVHAVTNLAVRSFAIAPDGGRIALVAADGGTTSLYVASVLRDADNEIVSITGVHRVGAGITGPHSVGWTSSTRLIFLGDTGAGVQIHTVAIDGTDVGGGAMGGGPLIPDVDAETLVAHPGSDGSRWVTDAEQRLWYLQPGGSWRLLDDRRFTALSTGD